MSTAEALKKAVGDAKAKLAAAKEAKGPERRALLKAVKRAQRRLRQVDGRKMAAIRKKHGGEAAAAPAPAAAPAKA